MRVEIVQVLAWEEGRTGGGINEAKEEAAWRKDTTGISSQNGWERLPKRTNLNGKNSSAVRTNSSRRGGQVVTVLVAARTPAAAAKQLALMKEGPLTTGRFRSSCCPNTLPGTLKIFPSTRLSMASVEPGRGRNCAM